MNQVVHRGQSMKLWRDALWPIVILPEWELMALGSNKLISSYCLISCQRVKPRYRAIHRYGINSICLWLELTRLGGLHTLQRCLRWLLRSLPRSLSGVSWSVCGTGWSLRSDSTDQRTLYGITDHSDQIASLDPYVGLDWCHRLLADLSCLPEIHSWIGICWANPFLREFTPWRSREPILVEFRPKESIFLFFSNYFFEVSANECDLFI